MKRMLWLLITVVPLMAQPPLPVARLEAVVNNEVLLMRHQQSPFVCRPYGVRGFESMAAAPALPRECRDVIRRFKKAHPIEAEFAAHHLHAMQFYPVEAKGGKCLLYTKGRLSYSEQLLQKGLAVTSERFNDREWRFRFERAQAAAQRERRGLWKDPMWTECAEMLYE